MKDALTAHGENGARDLTLALESLKNKDAVKSEQAFAAAKQEFQAGQKVLSPWGTFLSPLHFIPGISRVVDGKNLFDAGVHIAEAGSELNMVAGSFFLPDKKEGDHPSLLVLLNQGRPHLIQAETQLQAAEKSIHTVEVDSLPEAKRNQFLNLQSQLPTLTGLLRATLQHSDLFQELLGGNGPRKYLFLFQNNQELRATGGFIGSYALLSMTNGTIQRFFVDGIFNPDGQLKENIVPPVPIQKISAAWSLHDSNWFPDFPVSAEKATFFYEKTGGPTVDGIVTFTPTILERLLRLSGPIELPEYGVTVDADNFLPIVQDEVETKYDKEENNPKKILGDLTTILLERLLIPDGERYQALADAFVAGLNEREMLLYSRHPETETLIDAVGWSGRVLTAPHDYLSIIHSNINGYKTDGVIAETIEHTSVIEDSGSVIDTVTITRKHNGGNTPYSWWNKVNADYLRVYVPLGATLLSAEGMTREFPDPPLDYARLGFKRDADVETEEKNIAIDKETGTRIGVDAGKTVFGNWVYVSPQESVTVKYQYRLPFTLDIRTGKANDPYGYSILYQKQAGTSGALLSGKILYPDTVVPVWQTGENLIPYGRAYTFSTVFNRDQFVGVVLKKR